jgi:hypothetical protein
MTTTLWHYTCNHGRLGLGDAGHLVTPAELGAGTDLPRWALELRHLIWATDLDHPWRDALGLTQTITGCDRTVWRYRITSPEAFTWFPDAWPTWHNPRLARELMMSDGAMPRHWWVAERHAAVVYDP